MTSYTSADLAAVERAIVTLAADPMGRPIRVRYASGIEVEYAPVSLPQLRALRDEIEASLARSSPAARRMTSVARFRTGF